MQFKESEKKRAMSLQQRQEQKHRRQIDEMRQKNVTAMKELEIMQVGTDRLKAGMEGGPKKVSKRGIFDRGERVCC